MNNYKTYKDSDVIWLGTIPKPWKTVRCKHIFHEVSDCNSTGNETLLTVSHITGVTPRSEKSVNMFFAETMAGYKKVREGDLIINTMWAWMGALGISKVSGICSPAYNIYRNNKAVDFYSGYFNYLFRTPNFIVEMTRFSKGIVDSRLRLYPKDFYRIQTCLPSFREQTAIANYLDNKTQAIDKKINLLEKKIGYYQELRRSTINETVTKGLDKKIILEKNEIGFKTPQNWSKYRLKDLGDLYSGLSGKSGDDFNQDNHQNNSGFIPFTNIANNTYLKTDHVATVVVYEGEKQNKVKKGDIFFLMSSEGFEDIGKTAALAEDISETYLNSFCKGFRVNSRKCNPFFLNYLLLSTSYRKLLIVEGKGFTRINLKIEKVNNFLVYIPDTIKAQEEIVQFLDTKLEVIFKIIRNIKIQISTLKELRKAMINDVVTGKIKVI